MLKLFLQPLCSLNESWDWISQGWKWKHYLVLHLVLHSWGVLSDPVQLPQAFLGRILLFSVLSSLGGAAWAEVMAFTNAGLVQVRSVGPSGSFLAGMNCTSWERNLNCCWIRASLIKSSSPQPWHVIFLYCSLLIVFSYINGFSDMSQHGFWPIWFW